MIFIYKFNRYVKKKKKIFALFKLNILFLQNNFKIFVMNKWLYSRNPFDSRTKGSFKRMDSISSDTDSKLEAHTLDEGIMTLYSYFHPYRVAYNQKYIDWLLVKGNYKNCTLQFVNLIDLLKKDKIDFWDISIQQFYRKTTERYAAIFPDKRKPFINGAYDQRIDAVGALILRIGDDGQLLSIKADIQNIYDNLVTLRNQQQQKEGLLKSASNALEIERQNCAIALFSVYGGLVRLYPDKAELKLPEFFEISYLRSKSKEDEPEEPITGELAPGAKNAFFTTAEGYNESSYFIITNTGAANISVWTANSVVEDPAGIKPIVIAGETRRIYPKNIGKLYLRLLVIQNNSAETPAHFTIIPVNIPEQPVEIQ